MTPIGRLTIAIVDDEEAVLGVTRNALELDGYEVLTASNGIEAVELARGHHGVLALMLLDLSMPLMGGIEAIPLIRAAAPDLPILIMTGLGERETRHRLAGLGVEVIQKPFRADQLADRVGALLATSR